MTHREYFQKINTWDSLSKLILLSLSVLQITRWLILPQFMDIYYHLLSAWGFNQTGGYCGWDFWQYAPFGRVHIYPPFFQILLALLMKLGFSTVFLAKLFEAVTPVMFLIVLWQFVRNNYSQALAFFTLVAFGSAFAFYLSLINHIPSTFALIFGILAFDQIFKQKILRAVIFLAFCFYTHIGVSWFFVLTLTFYLIGDKQYRKSGFLILLLTGILVLPILIKQISALGLVSVIGLNLGEKFFCQIKIIDYFLAIGGLFFALKAKGKYYLFSSLFFASFIFLAYPYRFFSAEGYLPVIFLSAVFLLNLWERCKLKAALKKIFVLVVFFLLFISPTLSLSKSTQRWGAICGIKFSDSVLTGMLSAKGYTMWFPEDYLPAAALIRANSQEGDIIYSNLGILGPVLGSISGRATANALLTEIKTSQSFNPLLTSKIIVLTKDINYVFLNNLVKAYNLQKIGETRLFVVYKNPASLFKIKVRKASVPFWMIFLIIGAAVAGFWINKGRSSHLEKNKK